MGGMIATSSPLESWSPCPGSQYSWFRETMRLPLRVAISPKDRTTSARSCSGVVEAVRVRAARSTPARSRAPAKKRMVTDTSRSVIPPWRAWEVSLCSIHAAGCSFFFFSCWSFSSSFLRLLLCFLSLNLNLRSGVTLLLDLDVTGDLVFPLKKRKTNKTHSFQDRSTSNAPS